MAMRLETRCKFSEAWLTAMHAFRGLTRINPYDRFAITSAPITLASGLIRMVIDTAHGYAGDARHTAPRARD